MLMMLMNKLACLGLSILELSKIVMYETLSDYVEPKYGDQSKWCYMNTDIYYILFITDILFYSLYT